MKKNFFILFLLTLIFLNAQKNSTINSYKEKQEKLHQEINFLNQELQKISSNKKNIEQQAILINKKITIHRELLSNTENEINSLSSMIEENRLIIQKLEKNIEFLKKRLITIIRMLYLLRHPSASLSFILSANSYQQIYRRYIYLSKAKILLKDNLYQLKNSLNLLYQEIESLQKLQQEKNLAKINFEQLLESHQKILMQQETLKKQAQQKEITLRKQIEIKIKELEKINKKIAEAIKKSNKVEYVTKKSPSITSKKNLLKNSSSKETSENINANEKNLPWPVSGSVVGYFGEYSHPLFEDIKLKNNGIDIRCTNGSTVKAVEEGIVSQIVPLEKNNFLIIINHNDYLSVYSNITRPLVQAKQEVSTDTPIGIIENSEDPTLHFEIWRNKVPENPLNWLKK
jgi:septal ring factor EnvC (AmiA/AmiB activator)